MRLLRRVPDAEQPEGADAVDEIMEAVGRVEAAVADLRHILTDEQERPDVP